MSFQLCVNCDAGTPGYPGSHREDCPRPKYTGKPDLDSPLRCSSCGNPEACDYDLEVVPGEPYYETLCDPCLDMAEATFVEWYSRQGIRSLLVTRPVWTNPVGGPRHEVG